MFGIQKTIACCFELHSDFKGRMKKSVKYAVDVFFKPHRHICALYRHLSPEEREREAKRRELRKLLLEKMAEVSNAKATLRFLENELSMILFELGTL